MRTHPRTPRGLIMAVSAVLVGSTVLAGTEPVAAAEGGPGSYRIVLTGYPSILPTGTSDWSRGEGSL